MAKCEYEDALKESELKFDFKYTKNQRQKQKNISRIIIWFKPPFNKTVCTNVANIFLRLNNKHFPKSHRLHKILKKNTVKVSYSCMQNMSKIYKRHNSEMTSTPCNQLKLCNCLVKKGIITIKQSFNHKRYSYETAFSSYVWYLKETLDVTPKLK